MKEEHKLMRDLDLRVSSLEKKIVLLSAGISELNVCNSRIMAQVSQLLSQFTEKKDLKNDRK